MPDGVRVPGPCHRLVASQYPPIAAFDDVASTEDLEAVMELEGWTNDRLVESRLKRLPRAQWVFGRPNASIVMAAFLHGAPQGNRFTGRDLNAWYASLAQKTAIAEVAHHLRRQTLYEGETSGTMTFRSYGARLDGDDYLDLRGQRESRPEFYDRRSFERSQAFGERRRAEGHDGLIYDSLRHAGGSNVVCFVPAKIRDVVQQAHFEIRVFAEPGRRPLVTRLRS